jgi:transcription-repair coupling factor (superfamily II helicase)
LNSITELGLAVVDEEQRFGVQQRQQLTGKHGSPGPHVLYLSATPIPRTMCLAQFGDMDILQLKQLPGGHRKRIETVLVSMAQVSHVADRVKAFVDSAESPLKVFWVLPLVEGKEGVELGAAVDRHRDLSSLLGPERVGLLHGRMPAAEKNRTLSDFAGVDDRGMPGPMRVLVATSIIEVGIDVPGANICIIENAERFGLSQLHQIRGRIGRGESLSDRYHCVMLYGMGASADSIKRLEVIKVNDDGFDIAEQDLKLRGPGHLRGVQQTGFTSGMKVADFDAHAALMEAAHKLARSQPAHYSAEHEVELEVLHALFRSEVCSGEVKQAPRASSRKTATAENGNAPEVLMNQISPHPFAAVDLTSNRTSLVLVDVETTGLNHKEDRILQLACKVLGDGTSPLRTYMAYCDPQGVRLGSAATAVHGITAEVLKENGAQPFPVVWNGLREWLQKVQEREG